MKFNFTLILFFVVIASSAQDITILLGDWQDEKNQVSYKFNEDNSCIFDQMGYPMFIENVIINNTKEPIWIDFTLKQGGQELTIPGLLKIIDEDTIWIEQFPPLSKHPVDFSPDETSKIHRLKKVIKP